MRRRFHVCTFSLFCEIMTYKMLKTEGEKYMYTFIYFKENKRDVKSIWKCNKYLKTNVVDALV